ncbi:uncharacterized protein LOC131997918 [Stomoxys calcitrans]|uniref:uncharacterized protein LOC131997918 n=1 Tax=Stomoxys calcitrans TaxID=35570 RepID=UPI0027E31CCB|nr:uncharacterized protein LOC131997918 [Stomoxys calcitrans]
MNAAIKSYKSQNWVEILPVVMMGLHSAIIQDVGYSFAEMVFGTNLRLPGGIFDNVNSKYSDNWVDEFHNNMQNIRPTPGIRHGKHTIFVPMDLLKCSHVFVRNDAVRKPLQPPYEGPFQAISRKSKIFKIRRSQDEKVISIDWLKPAYLLNESESIQVPDISSNTQGTSTMKLRSGKKVSFAPGV